MRLNMFKCMVLILIIYVSSYITEVASCDRNKKHVDCTDLFRSGCTKSGLYSIWPLNRVTGKKELAAYCDMTTDGGGWTVIQRRGDFSRPADYFNKNWESYKEGFGDMEKSFYMGNDNIFAVSNQKLYTLRIELLDFQKNRKHASYDSFWIDDEFYNYTLHVYDYSGDAGDSLTNEHNLQKFSTKDVDNDKNQGINCAVKHKGAWWYKNCLNSNLNGLYLKHTTEKADGILWNTWKGMKQSLFATEMKIRPQNFKA